MKLPPAGAFKGPRADGTRFALTLRKVKAPTGQLQHSETALQVGHALACPSRAAKLACILLLACLASLPARAQPLPQGPGCTTPTVIDWDCDGYGPGSPLGPDADDNDPTVNTSATALAKYGSTAALLAHLGYTPTRLLFISGTGSDPAGQPNNEAQPYASWNGVAQVLEPGDAVIWRAGTYSDAPTLTIGGTPGNPIILMAYPGEQAILDQPGEGIQFVGQSNIVIDGLILQNSATGLGDGLFFGDPSNNVVIRGIEVRQRGRGMLAMNNMSNVLIERSTFHDITLEHGIYLGSRDIPNTNITVRYNLIYRSNYNGLQHNGRVTNLLVDSNIIHTNLLSALSFLEGVSYSTISNNIMFGNGRNCMLIWDYAGDSTENINPYDQTNDTFVNNTCWVGASDPTGTAITEPAIDIDNGGFPVSLANHTFENNIFVTQNYPVFLFVQNLYLNTATIRNNVMWISGGAPYLSYNGTNFSFAALNAWDSLKGGNLSGDPLFNAAQTAWYGLPDNYDFTLQMGSPALALALASAAPALDIRRVARGSAPDAGALESTPSGSGGTPGSGSGAAVTLAGLACAPGSLPPGASSTCTVTLSGLAPSSGVTVALSTSDGGVSVPASITVPGGASKASYTASNGLLSLPGTAVLSATLGANSVGATLNLQTSSGAAGGGSSSGNLASFGCASAGLSSGGSGTCTVTLSAPAPAGGTSVALSSGTPLLTVPVSATIPSGSAAASFTATAGTVSASATAVLAANLATSSLTASILLQASTGPPAVFPAPAALAGLSCGGGLTSGESTSCTVTLTGAAPAAGAAIMLFVNTGMLAVPETVIVPAGSTSAAFAVTARTIQAAAGAVITASYAGATTSTGLSLQN